MIRLLALFLTVGFSSAAAFLALPDACPTFATPGASADPRDVQPALPCAGALRAAPHAGRIKPRPFDEADDDRILLEVVREDGSPIAGAGVQASFAGVLLEASTDADGRASLWAYRDTVARVSVSRSDFVTEWQAVPLDPGVRRFVVPTRASVVGHVLIRGQPPTEPVRIGLTLQCGAPLSVLSNSQGEVEFFNLPENWTGEFTYPKGYWSYAWLAYGGPLGNYNNRLFGSPVSRPHQIANVESLGVPGDIDVGSFLNPVGADQPDQPFDKPGITIVRYESWTLEPHSINFRRYEAHGANVINLIPKREIAITILDSSGNPVVGATAGLRAGAPDESDGTFPRNWWWYCFPTGDNGRSVLTVDEDAVSSGLRASLLIFLPNSAGLAPDDVITSTNDSDEESVTLRVTLPAPVIIEAGQ